MPTNACSSDEVPDSRPTVVIGVLASCGLAVSLMQTLVVPLLPAVPGAHGVRDALAYGVKVTGATVHLVDDGVDTGPVLAQSAVPVEPGDTVDTLHERIKIEERRLLVGTVAALAREGATVTGREVTIP